MLNRSRQPGVPASRTVATDATAQTATTGVSRPTRTASQPLGGSRSASRSAVCSTDSPAREATTVAATNAMRIATGQGPKAVDRARTGASGKAQCRLL